jgi:Mn2+/Fe2+ NRAMP family transporter
LITGCADDDRSGISTCAIAGAAFVYGTLRTALISFPLMAGAQMMCGRLGIARLCGNRFLRACGLEGCPGRDCLSPIIRAAESISVLVGILGTTISPYLFFWEAAQEVEKERAQGRNLAQRKGATDAELRRARIGHGRRPLNRFRGTRRRQNDFLVSRREWRTGSAFDRSGGPLDEQ